MLALNAWVTMERAESLPSVGFCRGPICVRIESGVATFQAFVRSHDAT